MKPPTPHRETHFLGWERPLLPEVARRLLQLNRGQPNQAQDHSERNGQGRPDQTGDRLGHLVDLSDAICVLPTSRAAVRLRDLLRDEVASSGLEIRLPQLITVGQLPELLYQPKVDVALEFEQTLAWARAMQVAGDEELKSLVPNPPAKEPLSGWLELAATVRRLYEDLSANDVRFSDVAAMSETEGESERWHGLQRLRDSYLKMLQAAGLGDPHSLRQHAVDSNQCSCKNRLYLIGTSDLSILLNSMLQAVDAEVITMVAAPSSEAGRFDAFGSVRTESWLDHKLPLDDSQLIAADDVHDQAAAVSECLVELAGSQGWNRVTIGVCDESQLVPVETRLRSCDVPTNRFSGWSVADTSVGRLMRLSSMFLFQRSWRSLAALVRHADVHQRIRQTLLQQHGREGSSGEQTVDLLTSLDRYLSESFPVSIDDPTPELSASEHQIAFQIRDAVQSWLEPYAGDEQPMARWSKVVEQWLEDVYRSLDEGETKKINSRWRRKSRHESVDARDRTRRALVQTLHLLRRFVDLNAELDFAVSGAQALELLSQRAADLRVRHESNARCVNLLGWLDLALDDSDAMVVMGLNHPFVPEAITVDPFLPGTLRTKLCMADSDRRYARDCYAMHVMLNSRKSVRFVVGRRAADGSPTPPTRLLAAAEADDVSRRLRKLLDDPSRPTEVHTRWDDGPDATRIPIPSLGQTKRIETMSVTAFKEFLECPYRFYLRRIWKASPLDDQRHELAANQFGDLIHDTLEHFGRSEAKDETDPRKIEEALVEHLHHRAATCFGNRCSAAVRLQVLQAQQRLVAVAEQQARWRQLGWNIVHVESQVDETTGGVLMVDGVPMGIRGRFDRIDQNERDGRWAVLDYKTHGKTPEEKHLQRVDGEIQWVDLQLPLYRQMLPALGIDDDPTDVSLGYFNISDKESETKINIAEFTAEQLAQADRLIEDCVRRIRAGDFQPTQGRVEFDDYPMILQTTVANRMLDASAGVAEASL